MVTFLAMFTGHLPAPSDLPLPIAMVVVIACLPFYAAIALEAGLGRPSPTIYEVGTFGLMCGAALGVLATWIVLRARGALRLTSR